MLIWVLTWTLITCLIPVGSHSQQDRDQFTRFTEWTGVNTDGNYTQIPPSDATDINNISFAERGYQGLPSKRKGYNLLGSVGRVLPKMWAKGESKADMNFPTIGPKGTLAGAPTFAAAKHNNGMLSDSAEEGFVYITDSFDYESQGTIEFWVKPTWDSTTETTDHYFMTSAVGGVGQPDIGPRLWYRGSDKKIVAEIGNSVVAAQITWLPSDDSISWDGTESVHLAIVWDEAVGIGGTDSLRLYVGKDGGTSAERGTASTADFAAIDDTFLLVGSDGDNESDSYIDNFRVWNIVITSFEGSGSADFDKDTEDLGAALPVTGLYEYVRDNGTRFLMATANSSLLKMDALDGTWDDITNSIPIVTTVDKRTDFATYFNYVIMTDGESNLFYSENGGNAALINENNVFKACKYLEVYQNRVIALNITDPSDNLLTSRFFHSDIGEDVALASAWQATSFLDVDQADGDEITGAKTGLWGSMYIFKRNSIWQLVGSGPANWNLRKLTGAVGCVSNESIQNVQDGIIFLSDTGWFLLSHTSITPISREITKTVLEANTARLKLAVSAVDPVRQQYWCAYSTTNATEHDRVAVFNYGIPAWSIYDGININAMATALKTDTPTIYTADPEGNVFEQGSGNNDNGSDINGFWQSNWLAFGNSFMRKSLKYLYMTTEKQLVDTEMSITWRTDFKTVDHTATFFMGAQGTGLGPTGTSRGKFTLGDPTLGLLGLSGEVRGRIPLNITGDVIRFKFANDTPNTFNVLDWAVQWEPIGLEGQF